MWAVEARRLTKRYGRLVAVDDLSFGVREGEIFGLLGPNGAGKTTTVWMLTGLLIPDSGGATVLGHSVPEEREALGKQIGIMTQEHAVDVLLTVYDNLYFYAWLKDLPREVRREEVESKLKEFGLWERRKSKPYELSGGQMRRLQIARAMLGDPKIIFLDEPTLGLDPTGKKVAWDLIREKLEGGVTFVLSTNEMAEVEALCERILFLNSGRKVFEGSVEEAMRRFGGLSVITLRTSGEISAVKEILLDAGAQDALPSAEAVDVFVQDPAEFAPRAISALVSKGIRVLSLDVRKPSLEDAFQGMAGGD